MILVRDIYRREKKRHLFLDLSLLLMLSIVCGLLYLGSDDVDLSSFGKRENTLITTKDKTKEVIQKKDVIKTTLTIGADDTFESRVMAELYSKSLEKMGFTIIRRYEYTQDNIFSAVMDGKVDLYPAYINDLYQQLQSPVYSTTIDSKAYQEDLKFRTIVNQMEEQYPVVLLQRSSVNCGYGLVIRKRMSSQHGIHTITELAKSSNSIRFVATVTENKQDHFLSQSLPLLEQFYGPFTFKSYKTYEKDVASHILETGYGDVHEMKLVDGALYGDKLVRLVDDRAAYDANRIVPVLKKEFAYDTIIDKMNGIQRMVTNDMMSQIHYRYETNGESLDKILSEILLEQ